MNPQLNVMILGQTGVGKSSLINYLYGSEAVKTGTGKPVTGKGEFNKVVVPSLKKGTDICILDSWGLEANKADDWKNIINEKLSGTLSFSDMVYGIVYCSSYSSDRIQEFEIAMLKELLNKQYKVIIALTNADNSGYAEKKTIFREKFAKELPKFTDVYTVVDVCAQAKAKLGQKATTAKTFGKEELFEQLEKDFNTNFVKVVAARWKEWHKESIDKIRDFRQRGNTRINEFKGAFGEFSIERSKVIHDELSAELTKIADDILTKVKEGMEDAQKLYEKFHGAFFAPDNVDTEFINTIFREMIPLVGRFWNYFRIGKFQEELRNVFESASYELEDKIHELYYNAHHMFHQD